MNLNNLIIPAVEPVEQRMSAFFIHWLHPIPFLLGRRGAFSPLMDRIMEERGDQD